MLQYLGKRDLISPPPAINCAQTKETHTLTQKHTHFLRAPRSNEANNEFPQCIVARLPRFKCKPSHQRLNA